MMTFRIGAASYAGGQSFANYLGAETLTQEVAQERAAYYAAEHAPRTEADRLGELVYRGELGFSAALDELIQREVAALPDGADIDAIEARLANELADAATRADFAHEVTAATIGVLKPELSEAMAARLGIDPRRVLTNDTVAHLLAGRTAGGGEIEGKHWTKNGFADLTFSASKSLSVAWSQEPTEGGKAALLAIHQRAVADTMRFVSGQLGWASMGRGGRDGAEPAELAWITYQHYTSRPTEHIVREDARGEQYTDIREIPTMRADPQLHSHVVTLNHTLTDSGRLGSIDFDRLSGIVKVSGAIYHSYVARHARETGIAVHMGEKGDAQLSAVDPQLSALFSKRSAEAHEAARTFAQSKGLEWDRLSAESKIGMLQAAARETRAEKNPDAASDFAAWAKEVRDAGLSYSSVIGREAIAYELAPELRHERAYENALPLVEKEFQNRSVIDGGTLREIAARGLITAGISDTPTRDIDAVVELMKSRGVTHEGEAAALVTDKRMVRGKEHEIVSTDRHIRTEQELTAIAQTMVQDRRQALEPEAIDRAAERYLMAHPATDETHWQRQVAWAHQIGEGGRLSVGIGAAGVGKSTVVELLADAWREQGREVYGAALSWNATGGLNGIAEHHRAAVDPFLRRVADGTYRLDERSVVVVDEVGMLGNRQMRELLHVGQTTGATIALIGDPLQTRSPEAGDPLSLIERVLPEAIPELVSTIRQQTLHEREVVATLRQDPAAGLAMKVEDGSARLVPGGEAAVVQAAVELRRERLEANAGREGYSLVVMAPNNAAAATLSAAIREERVQRGEIGPAMVEVQAIDRAGRRTLALGAGDEVRIYQRIWEGRQVVGNNGDTLRVISADRQGMDVVGERSGVEARVPWSKLQAHAGGPVRLSYAGAITVETAQSLTRSEGLLVMFGDSRLMANRWYVSMTRHERQVFALVDESAVRRQIAHQTPIGIAPDIRHEHIWKHFGASVSTQQVRENAGVAIRSPEHEWVRVASIAQGVDYARHRLMEVAQHVWELAERTLQRVRQREPDEVERLTHRHREGPTLGRGR